MSDRQQYVDRVRELTKDLELVLQKGKFVLDVERFLFEEAITGLKVAEQHINGYLQVDKYRGN